MDVKKVAALAHLEITDEESARFAPQMADIVAYIEKLSELDTADVEPMAGGFADEVVSAGAGREDVHKDSLGQEAATSEAPSAVEGHFQVPKVL
jgi:aspartyl-tRNA(Asn)/glutamyl-tRNA(Gln) amidotransferase subunit C